MSLCSYMDMASWSLFYRRGATPAKLVFFDAIADLLDHVTSYSSVVTTVNLDVPTDPGTVSLSSLLSSINLVQAVHGRAPAGLGRRGRTPRWCMSTWPVLPNRLMIDVALGLRRSGSVHYETSMSIACVQGGPKKWYLLYNVIYVREVSLFWPTLYPPSHNAHKASTFAWCQCDTCVTRCRDIGLHRSCPYKYALCRIDFFNSYRQDPWRVKWSTFRSSYFSNPVWRSSLPFLCPDPPLPASHLSFPYFYPHMPICKAWIYRLLFVCLCVRVVCVCVCVCVCLLVRLRISPTTIKLAESNFVRRFISILGRESHILGNFAPQKPKIGRIRAYSVSCRLRLTDVRATFYL